MGTKHWIKKIKIVKRANESALKSAGVYYLAEDTKFCQIKISYLFCGSKDCKSIKRLSKNNSLSYKMSTFSQYFLLKNYEGQDLGMTCHTDTITIKPVFLLAPILLILQVA